MLIQIIINLSWECTLSYGNNHKYNRLWQRHPGCVSVSFSHICSVMQLTINPLYNSQGHTKCEILELSYYGIGFLYIVSDHCYRNYRITMPYKEWWKKEFCRSDLFDSVCVSFTIYSLQSFGIIIWWSKYFCLLRIYGTIHII